MVAEFKRLGWQLDDIVALFPVPSGKLSSNRIANSLCAACHGGAMKRSYRPSEFRSDIKSLTPSGTDEDSKNTK